MLAHEEAVTKPSWDDHKHAPDNKETADHSFYYCTAVALVAGECTSEQFSRKWLQDPDVARLLKLCQLEAVPHLTALFKQGARPAAVEVKTRRGTFYSEVLYPKGDPNNPMTWDDVAGKFMKQTQHVLDRVLAQKIADRTKEIDKYADVSVFAEMLGGGADL